MAILYESFGTDLAFPEWKLRDFFVYSYMQNVMVADSNMGVRPMTHYVESRQAVAELFDNIAYSKCKYTVI